MQEPKHDKERQIFQVERFTYFTDAVFAISITLLIIEIRLPSPKLLATDKQLWHDLSAMGLMFLGLLSALESSVIIGPFITGYLGM